MNQPHYPPQAPPTPPQQPQGMSAAKIILIVLGTLVLIAVGTCGVCTAVVGIGASAVEEERKREDAQLEKDLEKCSKSDVMDWETVARMLEKNEAAAAKNWKNACARVSGVIRSIDSNVFDEPVVVIGTTDAGFESHTLRCEPDDHGKAAELAKGQEITVWGIGGDEIVGSLELDHCRW